MSGEALYERYKDALKRGHVASLRGHLDEALTAYAEAAAIAPERSTPHASMGTALLRRERPADALGHYGVALQLAPRDESALLGRAQALAALGRPGQAADAYDALADAREAAGKLADAVDAARRGLELAEGRERRRALARLVAQLRESEPDEPGRVALEQALQVLEGMALSGARPATSDVDADGIAEPAEDAVEPEAEPAEDAVEPEAEPEPGPPPIRAALDRDLPDDLDTDALAVSVEAAVAAGDIVTSLERLLDLAAARRRAGRIDAALDACYLGLTLAPDDVSLHLALVELYDDRGWAGLAAEKLDLLDRLATLDDDTAAAARVAAARTPAS